MAVGDWDPLHIPTTEKGYFLDQKSGAVLNNNEGEWIQYQAERNKAIEMSLMKEHIADLRERVRHLERLIQEKLR